MRFPEQKQPGWKKVWPSKVKLKGDPVWQNRSYSRLNFELIFILLNFITIFLSKASWLKLHYLWRKSYKTSRISIAPTEHMIYTIIWTCVFFGYKTYFVRPGHKVNSKDRYQIASGQANWNAVIRVKLVRTRTDIRLRPS